MARSANNVLIGSYKWKREWKLPLRTSLPCATENISFGIGRRSDIVGINLTPGYALSHRVETTILGDTMHMYRRRIKGLRDNLDV